MSNNKLIGAIEAYKSMVSQEEALEEKKTLDPVDDRANDKKFKDRKDKDIDNDGDVDSSDEYLHKRRKATDDAIDGGKKPAKNEAVDDTEAEKDDKKKPFPPKKKGKEDDGETEAEKEDDKESPVDTDKEPEVDGGSDIKRNPKTADKKAEISKIKESFDAMWDEIVEAAKPKQVPDSASKPEGIMDKESPKSKEFAKMHDADNPEVVGDEADSVASINKAEKSYKKSKKRHNDNETGDKNITKGSK